MQPQGLFHGEGRGPSSSGGRRPRRERSDHPPVLGDLRHDHPLGPYHHPDGQRHRDRYDPRTGGLGAHSDLRDHGRGELRAWRAVHAGRLSRRAGAGVNRQLLAGTRDRLARGGAARRRIAGRHPPPADRARSADHNPRDIRHLAGSAELRVMAVRTDRAQNRRAGLRSVPSLVSRIPLVPAGDRRGVGRDHRRVLAVPQIRQVRDMDPCHDTGPRDGASHGNPGALGSHGRVRDRLGHGRGERRAVRPSRRRGAVHGTGLGPQGLHCRRGRRHGQLRRIDRRRDLRQPARILRLDMGEPLAGNHRLVRRIDPHALVQAHGHLRIGVTMTGRGTRSFWIGFAVVVALLAVVPPVLPPFWRQFVTEILVWGLLAMSSDILIGYTGMISFGHSAFFGLGVYGAAAALLLVAPPNLFLAIALGLIAAALVAGFVAYFSTRLRDIYFSITTLIFSQIFYVVIFTWTSVTGGENGLTFSRPAFGIPGLYVVRFTPTTMHLFVLAVVTASYLFLRRVTQSPFGMVLQSIRENEGRTRAIGYPVQRYKIVSVMLSGIFAGLAGVLYAIQNEFAAPDFVYFVTSGDTVIFNVLGGIGTLVGPIVGAGFFQLLRELMSRIFGDQFPYLIPLGFVFIAMIIFLPQGLLGFARRWLNR